MAKADVLTLVIKLETKEALRLARAFKGEMKSTFGGVARNAGGASMLWL